MLKFNLHHDSPVPIYLQVKQTIMLEILSKRLLEGEKLPSIRALAKILKITPNTIGRAYYSLEDDGFIQGRQGSGYVVKNRKTKLDGLKRSMLVEELKNVLEKAFALGFGKEDVAGLVNELLDKTPG